MTTAFAILLTAHGLIHLLGPAKAFNWADLPQLTRPISPALGVLWCIAAVLYLATAVSMFTWPRWWWAIGLCAVVTSTAVILPSWADAKVGLLVNGVVLVGLVFGFLSQGPFSLRRQYDHDVARAAVSGAAGTPVSEADLAHLPAPVQRYLRVAGVVGQPRVHDFRARMHGRIRDSRDGRWMPFASEQYNVVAPATRLFYLRASMLGIPVQGYHRYVDASASMRVKAASLVSVASARGDTMSQAETVTVFNDLCLLAPATLVDKSILWETIDARTARARFQNAGRAVAAVLSFNDSGELTDFVSEDRYRTESDGTTTIRTRWSTPIGDYRQFGSARLASRGAGLWHDADGPYAYIELTIDDVEYNVNHER